MSNSSRSGDSPSLARALRESNKKREQHEAAKTVTEGGVRRVETSVMKELAEEKLGKTRERVRGKRQNDEMYASEPPSYLCKSSFPLREQGLVGHRGFVDGP